MTLSFSPKRSRLSRVSRQRQPADWPRPRGRFAALSAPLSTLSSTLSVICSASWVAAPTIARASRPFWKSDPQPFAAANRSFGMKPPRLMNFAEGRWVQATGGLIEIRSAVTGEVVAETGSGGLDFAAMAVHARNVGGPALGGLSFHQRAKILKALADAVMARKEELYELSRHHGVGQRRDGAQGRTLRTVLPDRRDTSGWMGRHRRGRRDALRLCVEGASRAARRLHTD